MTLRAVHARNLDAVVAYQASREEDVEFLWTLPGKVVPLLTRIKGHTRPTPIVEDIAVPPASLHEFLVTAQKVFQNHEVTASLYSHAAAGQIHLRPFVPPPSPADGGKLEALATDLYAAVFAVGGTVSGEHGDGLSRSAFLRAEYGELYRVFQRIKEIFDPQNLLNPGKIVGARKPFLATKSARWRRAPSTSCRFNSVGMPMPCSRNRSAATAAACARRSRPRPGCAPSSGRSLAKRPVRAPRPMCCGTFSRAASIRTSGRATR